MYKNHLGLLIVASSLLVGSCLADYVDQDQLADKAHNLQVVVYAGPGVPIRKVSVGDHVDSPACETDFLRTCLMIGASADRFATLRAEHEKQNPRSLMFKKASAYVSFQERFSDAVLLFKQVISDDSQPERQDQAVQGLLTLFDTMVDVNWQMVMQASYLYQLLIEHEPSHMRKRELRDEQQALYARYDKSNPLASTQRISCKNLIAGLNLNPKVLGTDCEVF